MASDPNSTVLEAVASLDKALNREVRRAVRARWDAMRRECVYLSDKRNERLLFIRAKGWADDRLGVLCYLNSFYQLLIGPLEAATRSSKVGLVARIPIAHGSELFNSVRREKVAQTAAAFYLVIAELGFEKAWLTKSTAGDIIYYIERAERERDSMFNDIPES
jgi:hypothetical protein